MADSTNLTISCSFINYDGILITMNIPKRKTVGYLKKMVYKELTTISIDDSQSIPSETYSEDVICVESKMSSFSLKGRASLLF